MAEHFYLFLKQIWRLMLYSHKFEEPYRLQKY